MLSACCSDLGSNGSMATPTLDSRIALGGADLLADGPARLSSGVSLAAMSPLFGTAVGVAL
jgi:hypothetical protein